MSDGSKNKSCEDERVSVKHCKESKHFEIEGLNFGFAFACWCDFCYITSEHPFLKRTQKYLCGGLHVKTKSLA